MEWWQAIPLAFVVGVVTIGMSVRTLARDRAADAERLAEKLSALAEKLGAPARESAEKLSTLRGEVAARFAVAELAAVRLEVKLDRVVELVAELRKNLDAGADAGHGEIEALRGMIAKLDGRVRDLDNWRHRRSGPSGPHRRGG